MGIYSLWIDDYDQVAPESHHLSNILKALPLLQHFSNNFRTQQCLGWAIAVFATWALLSSDPFHSSGTTSNNDKATLFIVKHSELDMKLNFRFILEVLELNTMRQSITYAVIWQNAYRPVSTLRFHSIIHTPLLTFSFSIVASNHHVYQEDQQDPQINIIPCQDDTILRWYGQYFSSLTGFQNNVLGAKERLGKVYLETGINPQDTTMLFDDAEFISCGGEEDNIDSDGTQIFGKFFRTFDRDLFPPLWLPTFSGSMAPTTVYLMIVLVILFKWEQYTSQSMFLVARYFRWLMNLQMLPLFMRGYWGALLLSL
ncbi:hypothetical protein SERLADRAFT_410775 [Serpula lacrymans var. lacrymans S7.9]|uniref:Uncharacterized protein n=1 Tax=Serpula lacrymans var. lacrymans (strain S7.9) TaxID=578457 RepID=F8P7E0_SERL9|nr:uncharacterized protein SERLADRAFT_410775 [Serpula lacrymans var. lacrymans S7.9]EGO21356.1 hypothetical protein SERLADRAFT_410775 [Serpula lacrymans var. lacrymans S7.9]